MTARKMIRACLRMQARAHARGCAIRCYASRKGRNEGARPAEPSGQDRLYAMSRLPWEAHKVVGVSFEGRQAALEKLAYGEPVACVREPENPYDPNAVAVRTLEGESLGYIPREETARFPHDTAFGVVCGVGRNQDSGLLGAKIAVQPTVPGVEVYSFPEGLRQYAYLAQHLNGHGWEAACEAERRAAHGRCRLTGATATAVYPRWRFDDSAHILHLAGFALLCSEAAAVQHLLVVEHDRQRALQKLLAEWNAWRPADAARYVAAAATLAARRGKQDWAVDLALLAQLGISQPEL